MINFDYHTHTTYSHGKGTIMENAVAAKEKGLLGIAITDHGFSHPAFGMRRSKIQKMKSECLEAEKATGIKVLLGIESNILGENGKTDVKFSDYENIDVFLAGVHRFVYYDKPKDFWKLLVRNFMTTAFKVEQTESSRKYNTKCYINAIKNNPIDIITHLNYLTFANAKEVAKCCADYGTYIEINTKKIHLSINEWEDVLSTDVKFIIDSDAHSVDRIGDMSLYYKLNEKLHFPEERIMNLGDKHPTFRFNEFKKKI